MVGGGFYRLPGTPRPPPGRETYKPPLVRGDAPDEPVPEKHRHLRLRRRRIARMPATPLVVRLVLLAAVVAGAIVTWRVFGIWGS